MTNKLVSHLFLSFLRWDLLYCQPLPILPLFEFRSDLRLFVWLSRRDFAAVLADAPPAPAVAPAPLRRPAMRRPAMRRPSRR